MKAVILAGGLGTRLSEETAKIPKPMIEIGGKPILWHILKQEAMLRLALREVGLNYRDLSIRIDHANGKSFVNGVELPVIYPPLFF